MKFMIPWTTYGILCFLLDILKRLIDHIVKSNREGGSGRSDIFIKSASLRGIAIVIEFKIVENINDLAKKADR